jgi:hypothetical protein
MLLSRFPGIRDMHVLDLGGNIEFWKASAFRPAHVTLVNLEPSSVDVPWAECRIGDACSLAPELGDFDLAFSNSVLEHVGGHSRRQQFADAVLSAAPHHWVQTPYRYFPVEPHFLFPAQQFFPAPLRVRIASNWRHSHLHPATARAAMEDVLSIELIGAAELQHYFPASTIVKERFLGLTKSIIATA